MYYSITGSLIQIIIIILVLIVFYVITFIIRKQITFEKGLDFLDGGGVFITLKIKEQYHRALVSSDYSKGDLEGLTRNFANFPVDASTSIARSNSQSRKKKTRWAKSLRASSSKIGPSLELHPQRGAHKERGNDSAQIRAAQPAFDSDNSAYVAEVRLPVPNDFLSFYVPSDPSAPAVAPTAEEEAGRAACSFREANCSIESRTHAIIGRHLIRGAVVLETGARYGTTSCFIAALLGNSGHLVSVEPDSSVWSALEENRQSHNCQFWIVRGVIAESSSNSNSNSNGGVGGVLPYRHTNQGYASRTFPSSSSSSMSGGSQYDPSVSRRAWTLSEISTITGLRFDTLVIDCEGCIQFLFPLSLSAAALAQRLEHVRTMIIEADMPVFGGIETDCSALCVDYGVWIQNFRAVGFELVEKTLEPEYPWIFFYVLVRR